MPEAVGRVVGQVEGGVFVCEGGLAEEGYLCRSRSDDINLLHSDGSLQSDLRGSSAGSTERR